MSNVIGSIVAIACGVVLAYWAWQFAKFLVRSSHK
jgi:hypothetical protein